MGTFGGSYCEVLSKLILNSMITGTKKKKEEEQRKKRKRTKKEKKKLTPPLKIIFQPPSLHELLHGFWNAMSRYYNGSVLTKLIFNEEIKSLKEGLLRAISGMWHNVFSDANADILHAIYHGRIFKKIFKLHNINSLFICFK